MDYAYAPLVDQRDKIMRDFNFKRVLRTMKALNWKWAKNKSVPSMADLKETALMLLNDCMKPDCIGMATGGFYATRTNGLLRLSFCVADAEGDDGI